VPAQPAVRIGLGAVRSLGEETAERIASGGPYDSIEDLVRRSGVARNQLEALATAGALGGLTSRSGASGHLHHECAGDRRSQLWAAGPLAQATTDRLPGLVVGTEAPPLPEPSALDETEADMWATGVTARPTAIELARPRLEALGVVPAARLIELPEDRPDPSEHRRTEREGTDHDGYDTDHEGYRAGPRVLVAGVVTHRQMPESAGGTVFLNLEDETGLVNVICSRGAWTRWRNVARHSPALLVRGRLERTQGAVSVVAETFAELDLDGSTLPPARDFR
jgi:error-prone DNA polymerase